VFKSLLACSQAAATAPQSQAPELQWLK